MRERASEQARERESERVREEGKGGGGERPLFMATQCLRHFSLWSPLKGGFVSSTSYSGVLCVYIFKIYVCIYACVCIHKIYIYVCMHVCVHVCMYV